jgi:hypothetical protein
MMSDGDDKDQIGFYGIKQTVGKMKGHFAADSASYFFLRHGDEK